MAADIKICRKAKEFYVLKGTGFHGKTLYFSQINNFTVTGKAAVDQSYNFLSHI